MLGCTRSHRQCHPQRGSHVPELYLTLPERQFLTRIAKGRDGRHRPVVWQVERARALLKCDAGPPGAGETDAPGAAALEVSDKASGPGRAAR